MKREVQFGQALAVMRKQRGLTQGQLAEKLDVNQSLIAKWESGRVQPRSSTLKRLAELLGVEPHELVGGELGKISSTLKNIDPKLMDLFAQAHKLSEADREAVRRVLEAMLTRSKVQEAIAS